jgi:hypothetical protein
MRHPDPSAQTALFASYGLHAQGPADTDDDRSDAFTATTQRAYRFTTENLGGFMEGLGLAGKRVTAICGSGDFPINACALGARSVAAVDVMPSACMYGELKVAGLRQFTHSEFIGFYTSGPEAFAFESYVQLRAALSDQTRAYFDRLITPTGVTPFLATRFFIKRMPDSWALSMNPYLASTGLHRRAADNGGIVWFHPTTITGFLQSTEPASQEAIYVSNVFAYLSDAAVRRLVAFAASRLTANGKLIAVNPLTPDREVSECKAYNVRLARSHGLRATQDVVPLSEADEPGHGFLICSMVQAAP